MEHIGHEHEHEHTHSHDNGTEAVMTDSEKLCALISYMIDHNDHHAGELAELLPSLEGAANKKLLQAIGTFEAANVQLREVLDLVKEGK